MKLDPRTKLLLILLLTTLAVLAKDIVYLGAVASAALITDIILRLDIISAFKRLRHFLSVLVFIALAQSVFVKSGEVILSAGKVNLLTTGGLVSAAEFVLRMSVILFAGIIAASSEGREMTDGMLLLGMPYELAFMSSVALRFLPVFRDEFSSRLSALALRGIDIKKLRVGKKLRVYGYLISPAVLGCIIRSEELARAMSARAFRAEKKRTMLRRLKFTAADYLVIAASVCLTAAYLAVMYTKGAILAL